MMHHPLSALPLAQGAHCLAHGGLLLYPTETFYALGCAVCDAAAVARVYQVKHRAVHKPLPVIAADVAQVHTIAQFPDAVAALTAQFWPAPLTVLLPALPCVPPAVTGWTGRVAVRISSHATATALARQAGTPLVSSSANISGQSPVTDPHALDDRLCQQVDGIVSEGTPPAGGLPSTLVELVAAQQVRVLRAGAVSADALQAAGYHLLP